MKKAVFRIYATMFFLMLITNVNGQSISNLDSKNGFKDFIIGDDYLKWKLLLNFEGTWDDGTSAYIYNGKCCNMVFQYPVEKIILRFKDNKIVAIYITLEKFQKEFSISGQYTEWRKDDFENINRSFTLLFGNPTDVTIEKKTSAVVNTWVGKKIGLVSKYKYLGFKDGDQQEIIILSSTWVSNDLNNGF